MLRTTNISERPGHFRQVNFDRIGERRDLYVRDDGYMSQLLHQGNRSVIIATRVPPRTIGMAQHRHPVDRILLVTEGELVVEVGGENHKVVAGGAILIPAGVTHETRNDGGSPSLHLEIMSPAPISFPGIVVKENESFKATDGARAIAAPPGEMETTPDYERKGPGEAMRWRMLMHPANGSRNAMIYEGQNAVGGGPMQLHIHYGFDQFFFVTQGLLTVQIGLEKYAVKPGTLVVLPAGAAHTQWNDGQVPERHFAILTPPPPPVRDDMWVKLDQLQGEYKGG
jgi:quercetin dioxygenase-like cupin family protein